MNYSEFREEVLYLVQERMGKGYKVELGENQKLNDCTRYCIVITCIGDMFAQNIYLEPFYHAFGKGKELEAIVKEILMCYREEVIDVSAIINMMDDFKVAKANIYAKLINTERNKGLLDRVPHIEFLDFSIVYYLEASLEQDHRGTILITKEHVKHWNVQADALHHWAMEHTKEKGICFDSMKHILLGKMSGMDDSLDNIYGVNELMYVLTNGTKSLGAVLVTYPEVLEHIYMILGKDYYLLPSSIHEWVVVPSVEGIEENLLINMVGEINNTVVEREEILSYHIYRYDGTLQKIYICQSNRN